MRAGTTIFLRCTGSVTLLALAVAGAGCESPFERIDREVAALLEEGTAGAGERVVPRPDPATPVTGPPPRDVTAEQPPTVNPPASALEFTEAGQADAEAVIERLEGYNRSPEDARRLDLPGALAWAMRHSREYRFAEENYVLDAIRLLVERHRWGPRFFNEIQADIVADADDARFDTTLDIVNELRVTQRLPYGGEVAASAVARATEDLHQRVAGEGVQSADIILSADVPLLRGAGTVAREDRIRAERGLVYAARDFARFRRSFLFDVAREYLNLVVGLQQIENARLGVESFERLEARQKELYNAGRITPFEWAEARNETLESIDRLNNSRESYRLALDRFKVRVGIPVDEPVEILPDQLRLPTPQVSIEDAVYAAMSYRLDLQTRRDQVDDARRELDNARNALLGDLDLQARVAIPTDDDKDRAGLDFELDDVTLEAGITYGLPLDREIERLNVRQAEIDLVRAIRDYDQFRDDIAIAVRGAVRGIDSALFSLQIQEANVLTAQQREASIKADPARATIQQQTDAINQTASARDSRDSARRDLEVAVLGYLLASGQLRVGEDGLVELLEGMVLTDEAVAPLSAEPRE